MRLLASCAVLMFLAACAQTPSVERGEYERNHFFVRKDSGVKRLEPPPHKGTGQSTAYRYFDDVGDAEVVFRKRALHKGASIGMHVLKHDEVYYVVSGAGEVRVDDRRLDVDPGTAIFMYKGADVGIWQKGDEDLVLIVAYPPAEDS